MSSNNKKKQKQWPSYFIPLTINLMTSNFNGKSKCCETAKDANGDN